MGSVPAWLLRHTVLVEPFEGSGPIGAEYGEQTPVRCLVEEKRRLVRDAEGAEVVSETTFYAPLGTVCPPESRVTLPSGRVTYAIVSAPHDGGGLPTPDHLEVALQ
ncbi:hypothetical protein [Nonomuraea sp. NPDC005650]|uniref:hypothetical protein n=1 Tax=Nonomuraea sp. NPDC005650 TaxID=3157045 RepID=UPI0033A81D13